MKRLFVFVSMVLFLLSFGWSPSRASLLPCITQQAYYGWIQSPTNRHQVTAIGAIQLVTDPVGAASQLAYETGTGRPLSAASPKNPTANAAGWGEDFNPSISRTAYYSGGPVNTGVKRSNIPE